MIWMVKNLSAMQETWVQFLGWEDPLEEEWQHTPVFLSRETHGQRILVGYIPWDHKETKHEGATNTFIFQSGKSVNLDILIFFLLPDGPG